MRYEGQFKDITNWKHGVVKTIFPDGKVEFDRFYEDQHFQSISEKEFLQNFKEEQEQVLEQQLEKLKKNYQESVKYIIDKKDVFIE